MPKPRFLRTLRQIAVAYQAFERYSAGHVRTLGLTPAQFDIIATLGDTSGMSFRDLAAATLITKGTLTGVVDRLESRGLVRRVGSAVDGRSTIVELTRKGQREFERVFPQHIAHLRQAFARLSDAELDGLEHSLARLVAAFAA